MVWTWDYFKLKPKPNLNEEMAAMSFCVMRFLLEDGHTDINYLLCSFDKDWTCFAWNVRTQALVIAHVDWPYISS